MPSSVLTIAGATIDRGAANVRLSRLNLYDLDGSDELQFTAPGAALPGPYHPGQAVTLAIDGTLRFAGEVASAAEGWSDERGLTISYRALGLKWLANKVPVTHPTLGVGVILFNLPPDDPDYDSANAALSVGAIIGKLLQYDQHAADLWAAGIRAYTAPPPYDTLGGTPAALRPATLADLGGMTVVPVEPVAITGSKLWNRIDGLLQDWAGLYASLILADGTIRFLNTAALTARTLTLGVDPFERPDLSRDAADCFTRVVARGQAQVEGAYLSLADGTLQEDFANPTYTTNALARAAWKWEDFLKPKNGYSEGAITAMGSTSVTVDPTDNAQAWAINKWSDEKAFIVLENPTAGGAITYWEQRKVLSNTALAAGGTSVLTLDYPLANTGYTRYKLTGRTGDGSLTWRRYKINHDYIKAHLTNRFPYPVPFSTQTGVAGFTSTPAGKTMFSSSRSPVAKPYQEAPAFFELDSINGKVVFTEPTPRPWNSQAVLNTGGNGVIGPDDILVFVPVVKGVLQSIKPDSGYEGTAYTVDGIQRTLYLDVPTWRYIGDRAQVDQYTRMILDTVKDSVVSGSVRYNGYWDVAITDPGMLLSIAGDGFATGKESLDATVRSVVLDWPAQGALNWTTTLAVSTRRRQWTGERAFIPRSFLDAPMAGAVEVGPVEAAATGGAAGLAGLGLEAAPMAPPVAELGSPGLDGDADLRSGLTRLGE